MTPKEVAAFLRKSESWVYHEAAANRIRGAVRIGGSLRFNPDAIRALARGDKPTTAPVLSWKRKE